MFKPAVFKRAVFKSAVFKPAVSNLAMLTSTGFESAGLKSTGRTCVARNAVVRITTLTIAGVAVLAAIIAFCLPAAAGLARAGDGADCSGPGRVFIVGGTWDSHGGALIGVKQRYTGKPPAAPLQSSEQAYTVESIPYSATIWPLGAVGYNASEAQGAHALEAAIVDYQTQCGTDKKVVIAGYSQGARIAGDVLTSIGHNEPITMADGTTTTIDKTNVSGEIYSDPRMPGDLWGSGIELALIGVIPGLTMSGPRASADYGGIAVTTVCVTGDPICDLPDLFHDPIGGIDAFFGYWVKHNFYPWHMYQNPSEYSVCVPPAAGAHSQVTTCTVNQPSSLAILTQRFVDSLGINWDVPDLLAIRLRLPEIIGITLGDFGPPIRWAMGWLPPLPTLGYGAYLPDLFVFQDMLNGLTRWDSALFAKGAAALGASVESIVRLPVNFVRYWVDRIVTGITEVSRGPSTSAAAVSTARVDQAAVDQAAVDQAAVDDPVAALPTPRTAERATAEPATAGPTTTGPTTASPPDASTTPSVTAPRPGSTSVPTASAPTVSAPATSAPSLSAPSLSGPSPSGPTTDDSSDSPTPTSTP